MQRLRRFAVLLVTLSMLATSLPGAAPAAASPGTLYVTESGTDTNDCSSWTSACTLSHALSVAVSGDEIWVAAGTYKPVGTDRTATVALKTGVAIYGGFAGTEISRDDRDPATNVTTLSGDLGIAGDSSDNAYHVVTASSITAVLDGFTITGGNANGTSPNYYGAGVYADGSSLTLTGLTFTSNSASVGGGMFNNRGSATLTNVVFSANSASQMGGGLSNYLNSTAVLNNVRFDHNTSSGEGGGLSNAAAISATLTNVTFDHNSTSGAGGGMNNQSSAELTNVTFTFNSARDGGGMENGSSTTRLTNVTFSSNSVSNEGGGLDNTGSPTLTNVTFSNNSAGQNNGGGMSNQGTLSKPITPALTNVTFSGNSAFSGGGMYNFYYSNPTLTNVTFTRNSAHNGGGLYSEFESTPTVTNSILWDDTGGEIYGPAAITYSDVQGSYGAGNPLLGPLGSYGGSTQTVPLLPGSAAIDAGSDTACAAAPVNGIDQRGVTRPQGAHCDMGAFEAQSFTMSYSSGTDQSAVENTAFGNPLVVTVASPSGDPVNAGQVTFTAPASGASATFAGNPATIGTDGTASVTATANGTAGTYTVTASAAGTDAPVSFTLTNKSAPPVDHFTFDPITSPQVAGTAFPITITAQDASNNTATSFTGPVSFSVTAGTISPASSGTFTRGVWTGTVTLSTAGPQTITAIDDAGHQGLSNSFTVNAGPVDPGRSTVSANPTAVVADGTSTSTITVTLKDVSDNPVSGKTVTLAADAGSSTITAVNATTDTTGQATFTVSDTVREAVTYTATDTTDNVPVVQTAKVIFTVGNDSWSTAIDISPLPYNADKTTTVDTSNATTDETDPYPSCPTGTTNPNSGRFYSVWYTYTNTTGLDQMINVNTTGSKNAVATGGLDTVVSVWTRDSGSPGAFSQVGCNDEAQFASFPLTSTLDFTATPGVTYYIMVGGYDTASYGTLRFSAAIVPVAPNNDFAYAQAHPIASLPSSMVGYDTTTATTEPADPQPMCVSAGHGISNSVWFAYTPAANTRIDVTTVDSDYNTVLSVWTGSAGALTQVACNDNITTTTNRASDAKFYATADTTYYVMVGSYDLGGGVLSFSMTDLGLSPTKLVFTTPAQTLFAGTVSDVMTVQLRDYFGNPINASSDVNVSLSSSSPGGTFFSDAAGTQVITSITIASGKDSADFYYSDTQEGQPYIRASATGLTSATQAETIKLQPPDDIANAIQVQNIGGTFVADTTTATANTGGTADPTDCYSTAKSVWFKWEAPPAANGALMVAIAQGTTYDTAIGVYTGTPGNLTRVTCNNDFFVPGTEVPISAAFFTASGGTTYYFMVSDAGANPTGGNLEFQLQGTIPTYGTTTTAPDGTIPATATTVTLTATVSAGTGNPAPNGGSVSFTLINAGGTVVGTPPYPVDVDANGQAQVAYTIPGGTPAGSYTITAVYSGGIDFSTNDTFGGSSGTSTLTITGGVSVDTTTTVTSPQPVTFNPDGQTVDFSAAVAGSPTIDAGTVKFTLKSGDTVIGTPVTSEPVTDGTAIVTYTIPGNTNAGSYTIEAEYSGATSGDHEFTKSTGTGTLTINRASADISISDTTQNYDGTVKYVTVTTTPSGLAYTVEYKKQDGSVVAAPTDAGTYSVTVTIDAGQNYEGTQTVPLIIVGADLAVTVSDAPDPVNKGGTLTYTITVTNNGPSDASGVKVEDAVPANTTFQSAGGTNWTCATPDVGGTGTLTCTTPSLASGASATFTLVVQVSQGLTPGTPLSDTASVSSSTPDPNAANNTSEPASTTVVSQGGGEPADLHVSVKGAPTTVTAGKTATVTYTVTVKNLGPGRATGLTLTDTLSDTLTGLDHATITSVTSKTGTCVTPPPGSTTATCTLDVLAVNASWSVTVVAQVPATAKAGDAVTNKAMVASTSYDPPTTPDNNTAFVTTKVTTKK